MAIIVIKKDTYVTPLSVTNLIANYCSQRKRRLISFIAWGAMISLPTHTKAGGPPVQDVLITFRGLNAYKNAYNHMYVGLK